MYKGILVCKMLKIVYPLNFFFFLKSSKMVWQLMSHAG